MKLNVRFLSVSLCSLLLKKVPGAAKEGKSGCSHGDSTWTRPQRFHFLAAGLTKHTLWALKEVLLLTMQHKSPFGSFKNLFWIHHSLKLRNHTSNDVNRRACLEIALDHQNKKTTGSSFRSFYGALSQTKRFWFQKFRLIVALKLVKVRPAAASPICR